MANREITWKELKPTAERYVFAVLVDQPELGWARRTWLLLRRRGLTRFSSPEEHIRVLLRFIALGSLYDEFSAIALDQGERDDEDLWAYEIGVSIDRGSNDGLISQQRFYEMLAEERTVIRKALWEEFNTDSGVFIHFWRSLGTKESDTEIVNANLSWKKGKAFQWVTNGLTF